MKISSLNSQTLLSNQQKFLTKREKISKDVSLNNNYPRVHKNQNNPSFKGGASLLNFASSMMQWIESKGYLVSFIIQDGLGMTAPRVWTGFHRDKDVTGQYNIQEGLEVAGREGFTGPYIIGVAPVVLAATGLFCKSTNTNTRLIKRLGQNLEHMITDSKFDQAIKNNKSKFKDEFYRYNLGKIYKDTVANDSQQEETIKYLVSEFKKYDSKDKKVSKEALQNIVNQFNSKIVENSSDLLNINKVKVGNGEAKASFSTAEVMRAIKDFGHDAIEKNPDSAKIDSLSVHNMKNNFATKRLLTNIANIVVTLVGLALLPKLYAPSKVSPGAKVMQMQQQEIQKEQKDVAEKQLEVQKEQIEVLKEQKEILKEQKELLMEQQKRTEEKQDNVSFKGRGINSSGFFAKIGHYITKYVPEKLHDLLEYTGYNFSRTTFALLSLLGLLLPRGIHAWKRAEVDSNGKKDMTEVNEILLRDTVSSLSVVFAVPMLTKMLVKSYEGAKGFILTNRASDGKNLFKKTIDLINPYSDLEVLSVADLDGIYGNIDSKAKLMNFSNFVDKKGGDLEKILSKSENVNEVFNKNTFTLDSIKNLSKKEKNAKIIDLFESMKVQDDKAIDTTISRLMKGSGEVKNNKIAKLAKGLNSLPGAISTVLISPILLGYLLPKLTYYFTRQANAKKLEESQKVLINNK